MKKSTFVVFLMLSSLFIMGSYSVATPTQPNLTKDFVPSTEYTVSDQSITNFSETLPNNVLFYPDALPYDVKLFASSGDADDQIGNYQDTWVEADYFGDGNGPDDYYVSLNFTSPLIPASVDVFYIALLMGVSNTQNSYLFNYGSDEWDLIGTSDDDPPQQWVNATCGNSYVGPNLVIQYKSNGTDASGYFDFVYYAECQFDSYIVQPSILETDNSPYAGGTYYLEGGDETGQCFLDATADDDEDYDGLLLNGDGLNGIGDGGGVISHSVEINFHLEVTISSYSEGAGSEMYLNITAFSGITLTGEINSFALEDINGNGELVVDAECGLDTVGSIVVGVSFTGLSTGDTVNITCNAYYFYAGSGETGYTESFADVSDWAFDSESSGLPSRSFTSDGDVLTIEIGYDDAGNEYVKYDTPVSVSDTDYLEIRFKCSPSSGATLSTALSVSLDGTLIGERVMFNDWTTLKYCLSDYVSGDQSELTLMIDDWGNPHASDTGYVKFDYIRIAPSDLIGWQHDFSTTEGISSPDGGTIASDSDLITLTADGDGSTFFIVADTTATASAISTAYYPMFGIDIDSGSGSWTIEQYDGTAYATLQGSTTISTGTKRFNMEALDTYVEWWRISLTASSVLVGDWVKAYSIANFSYVAGGGESTNDYSYVEDGKLIVHTDTYTKWNYDPTLSVLIATYTNWAVTINGDDSGFRFRELLDTNTLWDQGITEGELVGTTLEDFDLLIYSDCEISAISFFGIPPQWYIIGEAELIISLPIDETGLNMFLIFLGIIMVPASTIYLVHGGRENASMDKVFYFFIMFIIGWALIIGGIML